MPRLGSEKRRTGCVTCKKRRVKCDEVRPVCKRCQLGDRECVYLEAPIGSYSWQHLLQAGQAIAPRPAISLPHKSARGYDYFRSVVAPVLNVQPGSTFWTESVMQLATSEEATMHGMLAISMLYEDFKPAWKREALDEDAALQHYNRALRLVATSKLQDSVVLVASVLFICIEFLRGNVAPAITHCRHGLLISKAHVAHDDTLSAMLQHLSIFPYFFANIEVPLPIPAPRKNCGSTQWSAASEMDELIGRSIRLVRSLDAYRLGNDDVPLAPDTWQVQAALLKDLSMWKTAYDEALYCPSGIDKRESLLLMRFLVCWIWVNIAPERAESASDIFHPEFARIMDLSHVQTQKASRSKFTFEMGMAPLLHFVVIKCRHLATRLEALEAIGTMGNSRESLWDTAVMYAIGKRIIEKEHGLTVRPGMAAVTAELPDNSSRVLDSYVEDEVLGDLGENGVPVWRRRMWFFAREGGVVTKSSCWISTTAM